MSSPSYELADLGDFNFPAITSAAARKGSSERCAYPMGTEILRVTSVEGSRFTGSWLYYDGKWRDITGVTTSDRIDFSGEGNAAWSWLRADQEAAQKKLETALRPANFEDWLPSTVAKEIFTALGVVNWLRDDAEKFSGEHCPGRPLNQLSVYRRNQPEPDFLWNFSWDLNRTSLVSQYSSEFLREGRDIKTSERRALIESRAEARKDTYERDRQAVQTAARSFMDSGKGTLANIIAALEIDEIATLELLERGVRIDLEPTDNMSSTQSDGQQQYRVAYTVVSPFEQLERQLKIDLANMNYTSSLNLLFDMSANPIPRRLNFTCTYPNLRSVPKSRESVRAEMVSYSSGRDGYRVSMSCSS
ncbi:hypothetical protein SuNHUV7_14390 (plasmid) [Pseudoseohaeicola sp. NH-UV-7]|uniref:hypothetical protein n=1 Tax=Sulfitobacter sp. TBRI5 TaxID=2989732 RepID=UPI003A6B8F25